MKLLSFCLFVFGSVQGFSVNIRWLTFSPPLWTQRLILATVACAIFCLLVPIVLMAVDNFVTVKHPFRSPFCLFKHIKCKINGIRLSHCASVGVACFSPWLSSTCPEEQSLAYCSFNDTLYYPWSSLSSGCRQRTGKSA